MSSNVRLVMCVHVVGSPRDWGEGERCMDFLLIEVMNAESFDYGAKLFFRIFLFRGFFRNSFFFNLGTRVLLVCSKDCTNIFDIYVNGKAE